MALAGRYGLVEYDVPGPQVIHERWIVSHIEAHDYVVVTPDEDVRLHRNHVSAESGS